jgi:hypothetical protein
MKVIFEVDDGVFPVVRYEGAENIGEIARRMGKARRHSGAGQSGAQ